MFQTNKSNCSKGFSSRLKSGNLLCCRHQHQQTPKFSGLRTEFLNARTVALSDDYLAIIDRGDPKMVRIVDVSSGKLTKHTIDHNLEVLEIGISQYGPAMDRKVSTFTMGWDKRQLCSTTGLRWLRYCSSAGLYRSPHLHWKT